MDLNEEIAFVRAGLGKRNISKKLRSRRELRGLRKWRGIFCGKTALGIGRMDIITSSAGVTLNISLIWASVPSSIKGVFSNKYSKCSQWTGSIRNKCKFKGPPRPAKSEPEGQPRHLL